MSTNDGNDKRNVTYRRTGKKKLREPKKSFEQKTMNGVRMKFIGLTFLFIFVLGYLLVEIWKIKFVEGKGYEMQAIAQMLKEASSEQEITPNRGSILDRNGEEGKIAVSTTVYDVYMDVRVLIDTKIENQSETINSLKEMFPEINVDELNSFLIVGKTDVDDKGNVTKKYPTEENDTNYKVIVENISASQAKVFKEHGLKQVHLTAKTKRTYLHSLLASNVIGFERGGNLTGIEKQYDEYLAGVPGRIFGTYTGDQDVELQKIDAIQGATVNTTIDLTIQGFAEEIVIKYGEMYEARETSAIVTNPYTGEIIAMATYPSFDLSDPAELTKITSSFKRAEWAELGEKERVDKIVGLWKNFNVTDTFEPGSIFKPITVGSALDEGVIDLNASFYCSGSKIIPGEPIPISCHKREGHGHISLQDALADSCNVAMMDIAEKMGRETFYKYYRDFGFGEKTGVDLPAEERGIIFTEAQLNPVELATSSFGQRFTSTALQSMNSFGASINGGNLMKPYIVTSVVDKDGNVLKENTPTIVRKVLSKETSDYLRMAMEKTLAKGFTGQNAHIDGYAIGGKTGTGEQGVKGVTEDYSTTNSIITYFPVENPEYMVMVLINRANIPDPSKASPSPMSKELMEKIIKFKRMPMQYKNGEDGVGAKSELGTNIEVQDFIGMSVSDAVDELNKKGLSFELFGASGSIISRQIPPAGTIIPFDTKVILTIENEIEGGDNELVLVPDVINLEQKVAEDFLKAAGLEAFVSSDELTLESEESDGGTAKPLETSNNFDKTESSGDIKIKVIEQMPKAGIKVTKGTQVRIKLEVVAESN